MIKHTFVKEKCKMADYKIVSMVATSLAIFYLCLPPMAGDFPVVSHYHLTIIVLVFIWREV